MSNVSGGVYHQTRNVQVSFNGGAFVALAAAARGPFTGTVADQAGQGAITFRLATGESQVSYANVALGDLFVIAGQSNASGRGTNNQSYSHATLKAMLFGNDYAWKELADPVDSPTNQVDSVSADTFPAAAGTVWPLVATAIMAATGRVCAFVPCAQGATGITDWLPGAYRYDRATLFGSMCNRIRAIGGVVRAVLWWQGEGDCSTMDNTVYRNHLATITTALAAEFPGIKLMPCKLQTLTDGTTAEAQVAFNANAIEWSWANNANCLTGPDLSSVGCSVDGTHVKTDAELASAATLWSNAIKAAFGW